MTTTATAAPGELWQLRYRGENLGLALVAVVADGYALVWPVSGPADPVSRPAVRATGPDGEPVFLWPSRETGVDPALLRHRLGRVLDPETVAALADAIDDGTQPPLPFAPDPAPEAAAAAQVYSLALIERWARIGDLRP